MSVLAIVPARTNSSRVYAKNFAPIGNFTPVNAAMEVAMQVADEVVLTTDHYECFRDWNGVPQVISHRREPVLSRGEEGSMVNTVKDALKQVDWMEHDVCVLLQPTSLFRDCGQIKKAIAEVSLSLYNTAISVVKLPGAILDLKSHRTAWVLEGKGKYVEDGGFYVFRPDEFLEEGYFIYGDIRICERSWIEGAQIDTYDDLKMARRMFNGDLR